MLSPNELARYLADRERIVPKCTHLGAPAAYSYLRHLIAPATHWVLMLNPTKRDQLRVLTSLPAADYVFLLPITHACSHNVPISAQLLLVALLLKSAVSRECLCAAIAGAPMNRPERRRALREIVRDRDIIALGGDLTDDIAVTRMMDEIAAAPPAA
jgi:hypothetical protein